MDRRPSDPTRCVSGQSGSRFFFEEQLDLEISSLSDFHPLHSHHLLKTEYLLGSFRNLTYVSETAGRV